MKSYKQYLNEALITFGKSAYPAAGHVVIMAGGAGSGKGFVKSKLLGIEGYNFDVDELKMLVTRSPQIISKIRASTGFDLSTLNPQKSPGALKIPNNVAKLHHIVGNVLKIDDKRKQTLFANIIMAPEGLKPNLIFDITMKSMDHLRHFTIPIQGLGYNPKNIHIVWVVNDIQVAMEQNKARDRTVPVEILVHTHEGASQTMHQIIHMGQEMTKYFDGALVLAFNKVGVDAAYQSRHKEDPRAKVPKEFGGKYSGGFVEKASYIYLKHPGQPINLDALTRELRAKIASYVPRSVDWTA